MHYEEIPEMHGAFLQIKRYIICSWNSLDAWWTGALHQRSSESKCITWEELAAIYFIIKVIKRKMHLKLYYMEAALVSTHQKDPW